MTKKKCFIFRIRIEFSVLSFQNQYLNMGMNWKNYFNQCFQGSTLNYSNSESEQKNQQGIRAQHSHFELSI